VSALSVTAAASFTVALNNICVSDIFNAEVRSVLKDALPILGWAAEELVLGAAFTTHLGGQRTPLWSK
jgi:hypothetical protein